MEAISVRLNKEEEKILKDTEKTYAILGLLEIYPDKMEMRNILLSMLSINYSIQSPLWNEPLNYFH